MNVLKKSTAPRYRRDHITSYLLAAATTCSARNLAISLVEMEPGGVQHLHSHEPEQTYFILEGSGLMTVGGVSEQVGPGDCIFIPSWAEHGLQNRSAGVLRYLSAASPSFTEKECRTLWPLPSIDERSSSR